MVFSLNSSKSFRLCLFFELITSILLLLSDLIILWALRAISFSLTKNFANNSFLISNIIFCSFSCFETELSKEGLSLIFISSSLLYLSLLYKLVLNWNFWLIILTLLSLSISSYLS